MDIDWLRVIGADMLQSVSGKIMNTFYGAL